MDDENKSFSLKYVGRRFANARLPLDVLSDLPALRDLIAALAKQEFRKKNPDRQRVPQGFDKAISFALIEIEEGSAVPKLSLENEVAQQSLPNIGDEMEEIVARAFERVAKIYDNAAHDMFPQALPQDVIRALSKLGANIQDDERIEFQGQVGRDGKVVSLDSFRRKNLLTRIRETYTKEFEGIGNLTGIDATNNAIQVQTEQYGELRLPLEGVSLPVEQFDGHLFSLVEFSVSIALDAHDEFKAVENVHSVDLVRPYDEAVMRCVRRLQELSKIEKGWLGEGQGEQLVHLAGMRATQFIFTRADLSELFRIFPTEDGGISVEFDKDGWSFAVEIMPDGSMEIDGSSEDGTVFEAQSFEEFSEEFFNAFDRMTAVVLDDEN
ncbi:hypothetical protein [Roseivivax isoporae]|uniref:hypothetical protein n=1 Tax=Roseivivax isoporae TaxID=591206 RepID=UPI0012EC29AD|nr:hypothetical protein [Roseivivax isoporae]